MRTPRAPPSHRSSRPQPIFATATAVASPRGGRARRCARGTRRARQPALSPRLVLGPASDHRRERRGGTRSRRRRRGGPRGGPTSLRFFQLVWIAVDDGGSCPNSLPTHQATQPAPYPWHPLRLTSMTDRNWSGVSRCGRYRGAHAGVVHQNVYPPGMLQSPRRPAPDSRAGRRRRRGPPARCGPPTPPARGCRLVAARAAHRARRGPPASARAWANATPRPLDAPVTMATRSSRRKRSRMGSAVLEVMPCIVFIYVACLQCIAI